MSPEQKAGFLLDKYFESLMPINPDVRKRLVAAKASAIICAEELIASWDQYNGMYDQDFFDSETTYWQKVLDILKSK